MTIDYSWNKILDKVIKLKENGCFGDKISFLYLDVKDNGQVIYHDPVKKSTREITDEIFLNQVYKILYHYSMGDCKFRIEREKEKFTKISLLDDSLHIACSTNQHRIESDLCQLFEKDEGIVSKTLETYFGATKMTQGDLSYRIELIPGVISLIVYNKGESDDEDEDDDFPGEVLESTLNIFFEQNTLKLLPSDMSVLRVPEVLEDVFLRVLKMILQELGMQS
ncbi:MAG: hypothetical protein ACTSXU_18245 [Promethearchaeota archaeon]